MHKLFKEGFSMDKKDKALSGFYSLFYFASVIPEYSDEELHAIYGSIPMTDKLFEKCIKKSFSLYDFSTARSLTKEYPELAKKSLFLKTQDMTCIK